MPLYEYQCDACGQRFEMIQKFSDAPPETCTKCGKGPVTRLLSSPAIQFKGTGWYITDYAQKGKSDATAAKPAGGGTAETKSEGKAEGASESSSTNSGSASASSTPSSTTPSKDS